MRQEAESRGPIRYVINTEHHVDHIFGNYYFKGTGPVVHHQGVYDNFMVPGPDLDPFDYAAEAIPTDDPKERLCSRTGTSTTRIPTRVSWCSARTWTCGSVSTRSTSSTLPATRQARSRCTSRRSGSFSPATRSSPSARHGS